MNARFGPTEAASRTPAASTDERVSVTTDTVPHELEASHRALLEERENGSWALVRLTPTR